MALEVSSSSPSRIGNSRNFSVFEGLVRFLDVLLQVYSLLPLYFYDGLCLKFSAEIQVFVIRVFFFFLSFNRSVASSFCVRDFLKFLSFIVFSSFVFCFSFCWHWMKFMVLMWLQQLFCSVILVGRGLWGVNDRNMILQNLFLWVEGG